MKQNLFAITGILLVAGLMFVSVGCHTATTADSQRSANSSGDTAETNGDNASKTNLPPVPEAVLDAENRMLDGKPFRHADYKGKVVLVNLWATWCGPCRDEMPELVKLSEKYKDRGFEVVSLNTDDESDEDVESFTKQLGVTYRVGWVSTDIVETLQPTAIPFSYIVTRDGKFIAVFRGFGGQRTVTKLQAKIEEALNRQGS